MYFFITEYIFLYSKTIVVLRSAVVSHVFQQILRFLLKFKFYEFLSNTAEFSCCNLGYDTL
jgi:hypothetical protein